MGACLHAYLTGGEIQIGRADVPISVPGDTLDLAGYDEGAAACEAIDALDGAPVGEACVLSPAHGLLNGPAQSVPGGLLGSIGDGELTAVRAQLEWAEPLPPDTVFGILGGDPASTVLNSTNIISGEGVGLRLTVRVHLMNPFLGPDCYIGSQSSPVTLELTTGTTSPPPPNEPIAGRVPLISSSEEGGILDLAGLVLLDNSFAVTPATGCGALMDAAIDQKLGLPSPSGENTAVVDAEADQAGAEEILEHGWSEEPPEPAAQEPAAAEPQPPGPPAEPSSPPAATPALQVSVPQLAAPLLAARPPAQAAPVHASLTANQHPTCKPRPRPRHGNAKRLEGAASVRRAATTSCSTRRPKGPAKRAKPRATGAHAAGPS